MHNIIISPVITEKSTKDANKSKFTFIVAKTASKKDIKSAVEKRFNVNVLSIATVVVKGKTARVGIRRNEIVKKPLKKAMVQLKSGQKIDAFELGA